MDIRCPPEADPPLAETTRALLYPNPIGTTKGKLPFDYYLYICFAEKLQSSFAETSGGQLPKTR